MVRWTIHRYRASRPEANRPGARRHAYRLRRYTVVCLIALAIPVIWDAGSAVRAEDSTRLLDMSLEALMEIEVTSVSKRNEKLAEAAAAVYVITGEEIRQMGVTTIPDALRLVPGMHVASIDANTWGVSSRGFNAHFSNKLLVLIDGRSVYNTLFSGVWWDVQDVLIEDIDRIEVIRGPGATLWGANAVNGVINIITRSTSETRQAVLSARTGSEEKGLVTARIGRPLGDHGSLRVFGKHFNRDGFADSAGTATPDDWELTRGGFRYDWDRGEGTDVMLEGDLYGGEMGATYNLPILSPPYLEAVSSRTDTRGGHLLARIHRDFSAHSRLSAQAYYDHARRNDTFIAARFTTIDLEWQHTWAPQARYALIWGAGYRSVTDRIYSDFYVFLDPDQRTYDLWSGFTQLDLYMIADRLRLTLGSKAEHNDYTGLELQPSARVLWHPRPHHSLWAAVSRAVRTPSRGEQDGNIAMGAFSALVLGDPGGPPVKVVFQGSDQSISESVVAFETGYRVRPAPRVSLDFAVFYNVYRNLLSGEIGTLTTDTLAGYSTLPINIRNDRDAEAYGLEWAGDWRPVERVRLRGSYAYLNFRDQPGADVLLGAAQVFEPQGPKHQAALLAVTQLSRQLTSSIRLRYVDDIPELDLDGYGTLDLRLAWQPAPQTELAVGGYDLLGGEHLEFRSELQRAASFTPRRFYGEIRWGW